MSWPPPVPGPDALTEAPELGCLHLLDIALGVASNALVAANPELQSDDFIRDLAATPAIEACFAAALLTNIDSLQLLLTRYRDYLHQRRLHATSPNALF